jgi:hypothetical protein
MLYILKSTETLTPLSETLESFSKTTTKEEGRAQKRQAKGHLL